MARVRMLKTMMFYPNGYTRRDYVAGEVYEISGHQLEAFFDEGAVEIVEQQKPDAAPENKARKRAPRTKG